MKFSQSPQLPKLPLDLSTFSLLRKSGYLYVDKTEHAYNLITDGRRYFCARPRRFGKSLFVSTLKEILQGNVELFEGLWIAETDYHWKKYGVIDLDLSRLGIDSLETFKNGLCYALKDIAQNYSLAIEIDATQPELALHALTKELYARFGHVAILIDEYDNPILHMLHDAAQAEAIQDALRRFFAVIKGLDQYIDFVFITGVSSFSKAGLFSGINNLRMITLNEQYADICGYTDQEVDLYFAEYIKVWATKKNISYDALRLQIKNWYNGYRFGAEAPSVYNPFSLMNALEAQAFKNFWFQSGTPTFLINELKKEYRRTEFKIFDPENFETTENSLGIFDIGATPLEVLMFQTGYLTITSYDHETNLYKLGFPNHEVKIALQQYLVGIFTQLDFISAERISSQLKSVLNRGNIAEAISLLKQLLANVPYQLHIKEEKFYHALLQVVFSASDIRTQSEYSTSHGRVDLVLDLPNILYVVEVKFNVSAAIALAQIEQRRYYESFLNYGKSIILLGIAFEREPKNFDITYAFKELK